jgi:hypothetical protein
MFLLIPPRMGLPCTIWWLCARLYDYVHCGATFKLLCRLVFSLTIFVQGLTICGWVVEITFINWSIIGRQYSQIWGVFRSFYRRFIYFHFLYSYGQFLLLVWKQWTWDGYHVHFITIKFVIATMNYVDKLVMQKSWKFYVETCKRSSTSC